MRAAVLVFTLFLLQSAHSAPIVLEESGMNVSFDTTGDQDQVDQFKKGILPTMKRIMGDLTSDLGISSSKKVTVFFHSPETYRQKYPQMVSSQILAFYQGGEVHAQADNELNQDVERKLRHELTHLLLDNNYPKIPAWANEGLAMYEERRITVDPAPNEIEYNTLVVDHQMGRFISLEKLEAQGVFNRSHGTIAATSAYTIAYIAIYSMKTKSGMDGIRRYLAGGDFQQIFGMRFEKFSEYLLETAKKT